VRRSGAAAHTLLPGVHRLFSLAKRWLEGTHQGASGQSTSSPTSTSSSSGSTGATPGAAACLFLRLLERAVAVEPIRYRDIVANPSKTGRKGKSPGQRKWPGTLAPPPLNRPGGQPVNLIEEINLLHRYG